MSSVFFFFSTPLKFDLYPTKPVTTMHRCYSRQKILIRIYIMTQTSTVDHIQLFSHIIRITGQHYILYKKGSPPSYFSSYFYHLFTFFFSFVKIKKDICRITISIIIIFFPFFFWSSG